MIAKRGPRGPGIVYAALSVAILVVLVTIALTTRQPPPPTIAEFAPQAIEQIKEALTEQSSQFGSGQGGSVFGGGEPEPNAAPPPVQQKIDVPRVRRCVGDPPRQTEDPQSPPCVPYWEGENGGATAKGVTANEVKVIIPMETDRKDSYYEKLRAFFNKRFEFYGRKLVFFYGENGPGVAAPAEQQARAREYEEQYKLFASHFYRASGASSFRTR